MITIIKFISLSAVLFVLSPALRAQQVKEPDNKPASWSLAYPSFRIVGNLYYVGTYDLACYLIVTDNGNILINTGLASSIDMIRKNIESLGFSFADTKILLTTQAHYDHVGAMAAVKEMTGAKFFLDRGDSAVVSDGGNSDYALGGKGSLYRPVQPDRFLQDGDVVQLGNMRLMMLHHPGHTKGSCSFLFDVKDAVKTYRVLIANLPTIVTDKSFTEIPSYPQIAQDYAGTFASLKQQHFDIWLSSHAEQFGLHTKHQPGDAYRPEAFIDQKGYDDAVSGLESVYLERIR